MIILTMIKSRGKNYWNGGDSMARKKLKRTPRAQEHFSVTGSSMGGDGRYG